MGQKFVVDATLFCDLSKAGNTDDLHHTVSYSDVYRYGQAVPFDCLEYVCSRLCS